MDIIMMGDGKLRFEAEQLEMSLVRSAMSNDATLITVTIMCHGSFEYPGKREIAHCDVEGVVEETSITFNLVFDFDWYKKASNAQFRHCLLEAVPMIREIYASK